MPPEVCRKWNMDVKIVKKMSMAYAGYISKILWINIILEWYMLNVSLQQYNVF